MAKASHIRLKDNQQVIVERVQQTVVVKTLRGKVLGSYEPEDMAKFHSRYKSLVAQKQTEYIDTEE